MDYFYQFLTQICIWVLSLTKDSCKNSQRLWSDCTCGHSSLAIYHLISTKSHAWITFIKLSPMFCLMKKKNGHHNGRHLLVCTCGHLNLVIYHPISFNCHIWTTFIKLLFMSEYGFCPKNDKQDGHQNGNPFSLQDIMSVICWGLTVLVHLNERLPTKKQNTSPYSG